MLEAFILGFWTIWSSNRDIYALTESLGFMILVVLLRTAIAFQLPHIDLSWGISMGLLWAYVGLSFWVVNRFATSSPSMWKPGWPAGWRESGKAAFSE